MLESKKLPPRFWAVGEKVRIRGSPVVDSSSIDGVVTGAFPWADIHDAGPNAVVVSNGRHPRHADTALALVGEMWESRHRVSVTPVTVAAAMERASRHHADRPLVIADSADNPGGGGYGDTTPLLRAMFAAELDNAAVATLYDPETAQLCARAGVGAELSLSLGGKLDPNRPDSIEVGTARVVGLTDGRFTLQGPMAAGTQVDLGPTAVIRVGGVEVVVATRRYQVYDQMYFRHAGIAPEERAVIAVKSSQHFRAAFAPLAAEVLVVDSGRGLTSDDLRALDYRRVRRPNYPLDLD